MRTKALRVFLFVSILAANASPDDDFLRPRQNSLSIRSDAVLSGFEFYNSTIEDVITKLGKPSAINMLRTITEGTLTFVERSYEWQRKECLLRIVAAEAYGRNTIESIDVWGTGPDGEIGTTGRGLKLGDSVSEARRIYGLRLYFGVTLSEKSSSPFLSPNGCPLAPEPILRVDFDKTGRINHMKGPLSKTVCY